MEIGRSGKRVKSEDMLAIRQEIARYSYAFDSGDAEGWARLFTEDGLWESYPARATEPNTRLDGRAALRSFCAKRFSERPGGLTYAHHQSGIIFDDLTADTAKVRAMMLLTVQTPGESTRVYATGVYQDDWVKTFEGWRIQHRILRS